jgi:hypothetical protein
MVCYSATHCVLNVRQCALKLPKYKQGTFPPAPQTGPLEFVFVVRAAFDLGMDVDESNADESVKVVMGDVEGSTPGNSLNIDEKEEKDEQEKEATADPTISTEYLEYSAMEKRAVGKFPSLQISGKRNLTKRRKRDKEIPMHSLTTSAMLKFKPYHFTPLQERKTEEVPDDCSTSSSNLDANEGESGVALRSAPS